MKTIKDLDAVEFQYLRRTQSVKQIAEAYNTNTNAVYHWASMHNVFVSRITDWEIQEGLKTMSVKELALEYNVSTDTIYRRAKAMGLNTRASIHDRIRNLLTLPGTIKEKAYAAGLTPETVYRYRHRYALTR